MSLESVRHYLVAQAPELEILPLGRDSETGWLSEFLGVEPAQIAKALTLRINDTIILLMACGDSRLDNRKVKAVFGGRGRMLSATEAASVTGHPVGGVCPFGLATPLPIYCDILLQRFTAVVTGGGEPCSAIRVSPLRIAEVTGAQWVDVCEAPRIDS